MRICRTLHDIVPGKRIRNPALVSDVTEVFEPPTADAKLEFVTWEAAQVIATWTLPNDASPFRR